MRGSIRFVVDDDHITVSDEREGQFWESFCSGSWEPVTVALLEDLVRPGTCMLDIGAWRGPVTLIAASKGAVVHAFEPDPVAFSALKANVEANDPELRSRVHLHNLAITPDGAPIRLYTRWAFGDSGSSMLSRSRDTGGWVEVASTTFDRFVIEAGLDRIDLIKMDIEGGEFHVLPGLRPALERFKPMLRIAVHYPYLIEHFEKLAAPAPWIRRLRDLWFRMTGGDPRARAERQARALFERSAEAVSGYPFVYDQDLRPIARKNLFGAVKELTELVFTYQPLLR